MGYKQHHALDVKIYFIYCPGRHLNLIPGEGGHLFDSPQVFYSDLRPATILKVGGKGNFFIVNLIFF
jgi:hypothetical protein